MAEYKTVSKMCFWLNEKKGNGDTKFSGNASSWWWPFTQECPFSSLKDSLEDRAELLAIVSNHRPNWKVFFIFTSCTFSDNFHILFRLTFTNFFTLSLDFCSDSSNFCWIFTLNFTQELLYSFRKKKSTVFVIILLSESAINVINVSLIFQFILFWVKCNDMSELVSVLWRPKKLF